MAYVLIEPNAEVQAHWGFYVQEIVKHHGIYAKKLDNAKIEKVWLKKAGDHHWFYQFHIKSGHVLHHHHFTVLGESLNGAHRIINIVEGHNTLF